MPIDPELLARMPRPPADRPHLKPPVPTPEQQLVIDEARRRLRELADEDDDEDDGMTEEEFNQAVRDI